MITKNHLRKFALFIGIALGFPLLLGCGSSGSASCSDVVGIEAAGQGLSQAREDIPPVLNLLAEALSEKDPQKASDLFIPAARIEYQNLFSVCPEAFEGFGKSFQNASMTFLVSDQPSHLGELIVELDGQTFCVKLQELDGVWRIQSL